MSISLNSVQKNAVFHTLWQAAAGTGLVGSLSEALAGGTVNTNGVAQAGVLAGSAVAASGFSLLHKFAVNFLASHKTNKAVVEGAKLARLAEQVYSLEQSAAATNAKHAATVPAPSA